jgi:hypothetical protein
MKIVKMNLIMIRQMKTVKRRTKIWMKTRMKMMM